MNTKNILFVALLFLNSFLYSQNDFLSRVYFPNSYGFNFPIENNQLENNFMVSVGIEMRSKNKNPWFFRLSLENFRMGYEIDNPEQTNVTKSEIRINGFCSGAGWRSGGEKWRFYMLPQVGISNFKYPKVLFTDDIEVKFEEDNSISLGVITGLEFYLARDIAFIAEVFFYDVPRANSFWDSSFQNVGIRLGMTTSFF